MPDRLVTDAYCDGGVIGRNPSSIGGTWAWCWVSAGGERLCSSSGVVEPSDLGVASLSNNITELLAALRLLKSLPPWWAGTLHTDSKVTLNRLTGSSRFRNVPQWMRLLCLDLRRSRRWKVRLVAGHPNKDEIRIGKADRNGLPTSLMNVWCDKACTAAGEALRAKLAR